MRPVGGPLSLAPRKLVSGRSMPPSEAACWHPLLSMVSESCPCKGHLATLSKAAKDLFSAFPSLVRKEESCGVVDVQDAARRGPGGQKRAEPTPSSLL